MTKSWLLPDGVCDLMGHESQQLETARRTLLDMYFRWGYDLVTPPHFEFTDSLLSSVGADLDLQTFKALDPESGQMVGFRADITPQVSRIHAQLPQDGLYRFCYAGSVFQAKPKDLSARAPFQIGAEIFGGDIGFSQLEIVSLMLETMSTLQIQNVHLDIGHVGIYRALVHECHLNEQCHQELLHAISRKDKNGVSELTANLPERIRHWLQVLIQLQGGAETLSRAREQFHGAPHLVFMALNELQVLTKAMVHRYPQLPLYFDLGELRGFEYHSGLVFAVYVAQSSVAIARGGSYNAPSSHDVGHHVSRPDIASKGASTQNSDNNVVATGFSCDLKKLIQLSKNSTPDAVVNNAWILAPAIEDTALWIAIQSLRQSGRTVVQMAEDSSGLTVKQKFTERLVNRSTTWVLEPIQN